MTDLDERLWAWSAWTNMLTFRIDNWALFNQAELPTNVHEWDFDMVVRAVELKIIVGGPDLEVMDGSRARRR